jgi:hypothetical protein
MASAAVTAASAAAALAPFFGVFAGEGRLEELCDLIERPILLPGMMAMTSLATVEALQWLAGPAAPSAPAGGPRKAASTS